MKKVLMYVVVAVVFLAVSTPSWGSVWGDVNFDEKIDLAEAIHALQVVAGMKTARVNQTHTGKISMDEVWTPEGNPHIITGDLTIAGPPPGGATLTIQPGVQVWIDEGAGIYVGSSDGPGTLIAVGTETSKITFTSNQTTKEKGGWNCIRFNAQASASCKLAYCNIEYGGGYDSWEKAGNVVIYEAGNVSISNCTITNSATNGVFFANDEGFASLTNNVIKENGANEAKSYGKYGISIYGDQVRGIDADNKVSGNALGGVYVKDDTVEHNAIWYKLDSPYIVDAITVAGVNGIILTIEAGTKIYFAQDGGIDVGNSSNPGKLIAEGSSDNPIVFTTYNQENKTKGGWSYIRFNSTDSGSRLAYCTIEYGGGYDAWERAGNVVIYEAGNVSISNCTITNSATNGVFFANDEGYAELTDNTITANGENEPKAYGRYGISVFADQVRGISPPNKVAGNVMGGVLIKADTVEHDAQWHKLDAPYIVEEVEVKAENGVTLTIEAGAELQFTQGGYLGVGDSSLPGTLIADGSAEEIVFTTSNQDSLTKGSWRGIYFAAKATFCTLKSCIIEYAGGYDSWTSAASVAVAAQTSQNIIIQNSTITNSKFYGIKFLSGGHADIDGTGFQENTLQDIYLYSEGSSYTGTPAGSPTVKLP